MSNPRFATFWKGAALSPYERACLHSIVAHGHEVVVYSFDPVPDLPSELVARDAREIVPLDALSLFAIDGKPSVTHFTDYFRFLMFRKTDQIWVDTDIVLLKPFTLDSSRNFMGRETATSVCTALLRLDAADPRLAEIIARVEHLSTKQLTWGETGPRLLTAVYGLAEGLPESVLYPVHFDAFWKVFLPSHRDECETLCADATTLHLWNNLVVKMGVFKKIGPPRGSFLHAMFEQCRSNDLFVEFYPESVMKVMVHNAVIKLGGDAGIKSTLRLLAPSLKTTLARRWPVLARF